MLQLSISYIKKASRILLANLHIKVAVTFAKHSPSAAREQSDCHLKFYGSQKYCLKAYK